MDNKLKELRLKKEYNGKLGMTQQEVADEIGVTKRTYIYWEKGDRQIKPEKAQKLADFFKVPVGYLLGYESDDVLLDTLTKKISSLSPEERVEYTKTNEYSDERKLFDHLFYKLQDFDGVNQRGRKIKDIIELLKGLDLDDLNLINGFVERLYFSDYSLDDNDILDNKRKQLYDELKL